ncbi:hypothetical protein MTO96_039816 [Rhipicephalus appendiculatus]
MQVDRPCTPGVGWFTVADVIRRNCSLNPGLEEKVQELASVDENEAASRIEKSLKSFSELDEFMRVAGVVKYGVTCQSRDGKKQLLDVGRDCWLYLRQYIKVGDILDEQ